MGRYELKLISWVTVGRDRRRCRYVLCFPSGFPPVPAPWEKGQVDLLTDFTAIVVGCLPSFAIFIRGRVTASRAARYNQGSSGNKNSSFQSRAKSSRGPQGSVRLPEEDGPPWRTNDTASDKSLVQPSTGIIVTRSWSQNWHGGAGGRGPHKKSKEAAHEAHELDSVGK